VPTGVASNLIPIYGDAYDGTVGDTTYVLFKLVDNNGLPVANSLSRFQASGGAQIVGATTITNSYGIAEAEVFVGVTPGPYTITATSGGQRYVFTGTTRPVPLVQSIANAATAAAGSPVAPGSFIAVFGSNLSDVSAVASTARLPLAIDNVIVSFDVPASGSTAAISVPGHLTFASPGQVNVQVPWELAGQPLAQLKVAIDYTYSNVLAVALSDYAPAFFEAAPGQVSALDLNNNLIGPANPALRGQIVQIYANGLGPVANTPASGDPASTTQFSATSTTPTVTIGGAYAPVAFCGLAPGLVGLYQINVTVPGTITPGNQPIVVAIGGQTSKASGIVVQ
jgi:minor extracellular serine protease Vpr